MNQTDLVVNPEEVPAEYNAATYFIDRHLQEGRGDKLAFIDDEGSYSYSTLASRVNQAANMLKTLGLRQESRIAMVMLDSIDFPVLYWGAIKAGCIPMCINTLLTTEHYRYILGNGRPQVLAVSEPLLANFVPIINELPTLEKVIVVGKDGQGHALLADLLASASTSFDAVSDQSRRYCLLAEFFRLHRKSERRQAQALQPLLGIQAVRPTSNRYA